MKEKFNSLREQLNKITKQKRLNKTSSQNMKYPKEEPPQIMPSSVPQIQNNFSQININNPSFEYNNNNNSKFKNFEPNYFQITNPRSSSPNLIENKNYYNYTDKIINKNNYINENENSPDLNYNYDNSNNNNNSLYNNIKNHFNDNNNNNYKYNDYNNYIFNNNNNSQSSSTSFYKNNNYNNDNNYPLQYPSLPPSSFSIGSSSILSSLNLKYSILNSTLEKIKIFIDSEISDTNDSTNIFLQSLIDSKRNFEKELENDSKILDSDLESLTNKYGQELQKRNSCELDTDVIIKEMLKDLTKETKKKLPEPLNKINDYQNEQESSFNQINNSVKEHLKEMEDFIQNEKMSISDNFLKYMKNMMDINNNVEKFVNEEKKQRNEFKVTVCKILDESVKGLENENRTQKEKEREKLKIKKKLCGKNYK